jgi:hypothetical protein
VVYIHYADTPILKIHTKCEYKGIQCKKDGAIINGKCLLLRDKIDKKDKNLMCVEV